MKARALSIVATCASCAALAQQPVAPAPVPAPVTPPASHAASVAAATANAAPQPAVPTPPTSAPVTPAPAPPAATMGAAPVRPIMPVNPPPPPALARTPAPPAPPTPPVKGLPPDAPQIVINGGTYSPVPQHRMAIVNGAIVREGADLGSGVTLERIEPDGVVLAFHGSRYHVMY